MLQLKETGAEQEGWTEDFNSPFQLAVPRDSSGRHLQETKNQN